MKRTAFLFFALFALILSGCASQPSSSPGSLRPVKLQTLTGMYRYFAYGQCSDGGPQGFEPLPSQGIVLAGENAHTSYDPMYDECTITTLFYLAGILFDLSQLGSQSVARAVLSFRLISSETDTSQQHVSCATSLKLAITAWQDYNPEAYYPNLPAFSLPLVDFGRAAQPSPTPGVQIDQAHATISVDVTQAVNGWLSNRWPNDGLVLGPQNISSSRACLSRYTDFALAITH